jgi:hypothetical protein
MLGVGTHRGEWPGGHEAGWEPVVDRGSSLSCGGLSPIAGTTRRWGGGVQLC